MQQQLLVSVCNLDIKLNDFFIGIVSSADFCVSYSYHLYMNYMI